MSAIQANLSEKNSERVNALSRESGRSPDELVNEAIERFAIEADQNEHERFVAWQEAARRVAGIWKDRDDLPDFAELRKSWDRGYGTREIGEAL